METAQYVLDVPAYSDQYYGIYQKDGKFAACWMYTNNNKQAIYDLALEHAVLSEASVPGCVIRDDKLGPIFLPYINYKKLPIPAPHRRKNMKQYPKPQFTITEEVPKEIYLRPESLVAEAKSEFPLVRLFQLIGKSSQFIQL